MKFSRYPNAEAEKLNEVVETGEVNVEARIVMKESGRRPPHVPTKGPE